MTTPQNLPIPEVVRLKTARLPNHYFDNDRIEELMRQYLFTNCTKIKLRNAIMENASLLIRNIIRTDNLDNIMAGLDVEELIQIAWIQIERTLYKFKTRPHCADCYDLQNTTRSLLYEPAPTEYGIMLPEEIAERGLTCPNCGQHPTRIVYRGCSKVFNLWNTVARTVLLAFIKKEGRGRAGRLRNEHKQHLKKQRVSGPTDLYEMLDQAEIAMKHNPLNVRLIHVLRSLLEKTDKPHNALIAHLSQLGQVSRAQAMKFLTQLRLCMSEYGDELGERQLVWGDCISDELED